MQLHYMVHQSCTRCMWSCVECTTPLVRGIIRTMAHMQQHAHTHSQFHLRVNSCRAVPTTRKNLCTCMLPFCVGSLRCVSLSGISCSLCVLTAFSTISHPDHTAATHLPKHHPASPCPLQQWCLLSDALSLRSTNLKHPPPPATAPPPLTCFATVANRPSDTSFSTSPVTPLDFWHCS